jgi:autotransporter-associated beta strand protein
MHGYSKNVPCFSGDILGDWREEIILTNGTNIRIYTTGFPTDYSLPTLWHDHQYRQAMAWQMHAYNQPPHLSYYLGEMENITMAPPPQITNERTEISNGGTISTALNGKQVIACETGNMTISVVDGASPWVFTDNAPSLVEGNDVNGTTGRKEMPDDGHIGVSNLPTIKRSYYTHTVTGGAFSGDMHLAKQGDGTLILPNVTQTYTGETRIWAGKLVFDGTMQNSPVWLNRFTALNSTGGQFNQVTAEYDAKILPGGENSNVSDISFTDLNLRFGSQVTFDLTGLNEGDNDRIIVSGTLSIEKKTEDIWVNYGPQHLAPVFHFNHGSVLSGGRYPIGNVEQVNGSISDIIISGVDPLLNPYLLIENGVLYLVIGDAPQTPKADIEIIDYVETDLHQIYPSTEGYPYYMPKVGITTENMNNITPNLYGSFTDKNGNVTSVGGKDPYYYQDYNNVSDISTVWTGNNISPSINSTGNEKYVYISQEHQSETRSAHTFFSPINITTDQYVIEFDMLLKSCTKNQGRHNELVLFTGNNITQQYFSWNGTDNYLFKFYGGIDEGDANRIVHYKISGVDNNNDGEDDNFDVTDDTWHHIKLTVDKTTKKVDYMVKIRDSWETYTGSYTVNWNSNLDVKGLFVSVGRYDSYAYIDNISVTPVRLTEYTFKEPGTLEVTSNIEGYVNGTKTFTVEHPYISYIPAPYYSEDYQSVTDNNGIKETWTSPNAGDNLLLGNENGNKFVLFDFTGSTANSRCAYNTFTISEEMTQTFQIDFDCNIKHGNNQSSELAVMTGGIIKNSSGLYNNNFKDLNNGKHFLFDLSESGTTDTYLVNGKVDEDNTVNIPSGEWCHYRLVVDPEMRTVKWTITNANNEKIASSTYELPEETSIKPTGIYLLAGRYGATLKIDNISITPFQYQEVIINDELAVIQPESITNGFAHLWRTGLNASSTWATMVLPFTLDTGQLKAMFGDNVEVANLDPNSGDETTVYFNIDNCVTANVPFLIRGVSTTSPFLFSHINSQPAESLIAQTSKFQFIGTYTDEGDKAFYTSDYFYTADGLRTVSKDGAKMKFKGYRAYFHSLQGSLGNTIAVAFDDQTGVTTIVEPQETANHIYTTTGQLVRRNATTTKGLQPGVYIVGGKTVVVK